MIDEPEMCLHPPQAHSLGRFIGRYGSSTDTATLVATHSSQVLRGVIQATSDVQIVRLTRRDGKFSAHLVPADVLTEAVAKPTVRAESVLDGIFAQSVVVVEGDGDRLAYQTTWETLASELRLDVHFAAVGGTGGIADTCKLYRTLDIPIAVIADLDIVGDLDKLRRVLEVMATADMARSLVSEASQVIEEIRKLPPSISREEVTASLNSIINGPMEWIDRDDLRVRQELRRLATQLDRMRGLKRGGISRFQDPLAARLRQLVSTLKTVGIFLVPVGELEEWLANENIGKSRVNNKWAWANAAALRIQAKGATKGDIWDFVREVGNYLSSQ